MMPALRHYLLPALLIALAFGLGWREVWFRNAAEPGTAGAPTPPRPAAREAGGQKPGEIRRAKSMPAWGNLARDLSLRGHLPLPENPSLRAAIDGLSADDLLAAIRDLGNSGLSAPDRAALERELVKALLLRDPERGFSLFAGREGHEWDYLLGDQFSDWVKRDKDAALSWLESHAAGGGQVGDEMIRRPFFESLASDPATAAANLAARPPEARLESLRSLAMRALKTNGQAEWAQVVRAQLPAEEIPEAISWLLMNWSDGDGAPMTLAQVDAYMEQIGVTDEERRACILIAARQLRTWGHQQVQEEEETAAFDRMRSWVEQQDPDMLQPATLAALGEMARSGDFDHAGEQAIQFHEQNGDDRYLTAVLDMADDRTDPALLRELIGRISDPDLRQKHLAEQEHRLRR